MSTFLKVNFPNFSDFLPLIPKGKSLKIKLPLGSGQSRFSAFILFGVDSFIKLSFCLLFFLTANQSQSQTWNYDFGDSLWVVSDPGYYSPAVITKLYNHNNRLFVSGGFDRIGPDTAANLAYWNGINWHPMVKKWWTPGIEDMKFYKNNLYVCGSFQQLNNIANLSYLTKWDKANWAFVCNDSFYINSFNSMLWHHDTLFVSGLIGLINGVDFRFVAQWDGTNWLQMEGGLNDDNSHVLCSAIYNDQIYIGGSFPYSGGHLTINVARWDGQQWNAVGGGLLGQIHAMYVDTTENMLYAGGYLALPGDSVPLGIFKWDGQQWTNVAGKVDNNVMCIIRYRGNLYAGGWFSVFDNKPIKNLAKYNGTSWDTIVNLGLASVYTMAVFNDELIIGGYFTQVNGMHATGIARYYEPPDSACLYFSPAIYTDADTFYLQNDTVSVAFYNNNSHANTWAWNFGDTGTDTVWCPVHLYNQPGTYTVNVNVTELWCNKSAQKTVVISDLLNSAQPTANSQQPIALKIYPNPASGSVTIEITGAVAPFREQKGSEGKNNEPFDKLRVQQTINELRITDQHGKTVKTFQLKESNCKVEINTKGWAKGAYLCSLVVGGKTVKVEKLVIE